MWNNSAISVVAGKSVTTAATTINTATAAAVVPPNSAGGKAKYLRFAATGTCYICLASSAGEAVATTSNIMIRGDYPVILEAHGSTHWSVIDDGVTVKVNVTPLENA